VESRSPPIACAQSCLGVVPDGRRMMEQKKQKTDTAVHGCETHEKAIPPICGE
jgi:hypothetical protein